MMGVLLSCCKKRANKKVDNSTRTTKIQEGETRKMQNGNKDLSIYGANNSTISNESPLDTVPYIHLPNGDEYNFSTNDITIHGDNNQATCSADGKFMTSPHISSQGNYLVKRKPLSMYISDIST